VWGSAFGFAAGIADADRIGASAKVQAANPINKRRFMMCHSLDRVIAVMYNALGTEIVPWMPNEQGFAADLLAKASAHPFKADITRIVRHIRNGPSTDSWLIALHHGRSSSFDRGHPR
jgi:hypothetical protein